MTNRALILAALAGERSTLHAPLVSRDTALMIDALRTLGVVVDTSAAQHWTVSGGLSATGEAAIDVGNAGTVLRFVPPLAALTGALVHLDGDPAARLRPVRPLLDALRHLGIDIEDGGRGALPFSVRGSASARGGDVDIDASASSQLVSALLLAGPRFSEGIAIRHVGHRDVPNAPHIAMTVSMLRERGVAVTADDRAWSVTPGPVAPVDTTIEPDLSGAAPFLAAAVVTAGRVTVADWPEQSTQPGSMLPALLQRFGASVRPGTDGLTVSGPDVLSGADLDLRDAGELTPVLAAVAALASSPSRFIGIDYLRGHETDRLAALASEINRLGGAVTELPDGLEIIPKPLHGNHFSTYDDHRLAMAAAVIGLAVPGVLVENVATTAKTMPDFPDRWSEAVR
jgi:3-phosphoshikimate 1-carboxyvinyltransferase